MKVMYRVEDHHWWYLGMERISCSLLERALPPEPGARSLRILDAGCGTGAVMKYLAQYGEVTGFDFSAQALKFSRRRGHSRLVQASALQVPFATSSFDVLVSFDLVAAVWLDFAVPDDTRGLRPTVGGVVQILTTQRFEFALALAGAMLGGQLLRIRPRRMDR